MASALNCPAVPELAEAFDDAPPLAPPRSLRSLQSECGGTRTCEHRAFEEAAAVERRPLVIIRSSFPRACGIACLFNTIRSVRISRRQTSHGMGEFRRFHPRKGWGRYGGIMGRASGRVPC